VREGDFFLEAVEIAEKSRFPQGIEFHRQHIQREAE
jgi:hypothetical protein